MTPPYGGDAAGVMNNTDSHEASIGDADGDLDFRIDSRPNCRATSESVSVRSASARSPPVANPAVNLVGTTAAMDKETSGRSVLRHQQSPARPERRYRKVQARLPRRCQDLRPGKDRAVRL